MADQKITQLNPLLAADAQATVDVLPVADVSTAETKKITLADAVTSGIGSIANNTIPGAKLQTGTVTASQIGTGEVGTTQLADSSVTTAKINDAAVTTAKIATDAVTATQIAANAVGSSELADNAVDTAAIQANAITTAKIADGAVTAAKIAAGVLSGNQITDGSINTQQLATEAVTTEKIEDGAVTSAKIATGAVSADSIAANAVVTAKILDGNVTTAKIADDAITAAKIATGAVGTTEIADSSVTTSKINAGAVTTATIAADAVTATEIADNAIVTAGIANAAVTTAKIADANVTTAKIVDGAITTAKIATGAIGASEIADSSITSVELADGAVTTAKIADDAVTAAKIAPGGVDTTALGASAVTAAKIADGTITAAKLANDLDGSEFLAQSANIVLAGPATGADAVPTFRALTAEDIPLLTAAQLPIAASGVRGTVSVGTGLAADAGGVLSISNTVTGATSSKVTFNSSGLITGSADLTDADIPNLPASKITSGTFASGYIANGAITAAKIADEATVQFGGSGSTAGVVTFPTANFKGQYFFDELNQDLYIWSGSAWLPVTIISGELVYAGTYDASTNLVASVTSAGSAAGLVVDSALPAAAGTNNRYYLVVSDSGTGSGNAPAEALAPPDMILSNGSTWDLIDVSNAIAGQTAANISFTPFGDIAATNVQTAIQELDTEKLPTYGGTLTGSLTLGTGASLVFEGSTADDYETTFAVVDPTADRTITLPDASGTVLTTGSTNSVTSAMIVDGTIVNGDINATAGIEFSKLAALTSGNIIVGSSGNVATSVAVTGDVTISNTGVTAISSGVIVNADINSSAAIAYSKLAPLSSGNIIIGSNSNVATTVAVTGDITISSAGVTAIAAGAVVDADISASAEIAVSKLANGTARQLLQTNAAGTDVEWTSNVDIPGTLDVTGAAVFDSTVTIGGSAALVASAIGSTVQAYDADTAKYDDTTANFTGTLQNGGSNVVVDSDIGVTVQAYDADTAKLDVVQTFTAVQTLTDPAIVGTILEDVYTITDGAAFEVDPGNGSVQLITLGANRTPKATNFAAGEAVTLMVADGTAYTLTWTDTTWGTSGVVWTGGSAPTLATSGYTVIQFWKVGSQVYGATVGDVA